MSRQIGEPRAICEQRKIVWRGFLLSAVLHNVADWLAEHYFDGEPQAITIEHLPEPDGCEDDFGGDWLVMLFQDV